MVVVAAELRPFRVAAAHPLDAERLPVRLPPDDHRDEIVARVGETTAGATEATTTAATTADRGWIHPDQGPDAADRIECGVTSVSYTHLRAHETPEQLV